MGFPGCSLHRGDRGTQGGSVQEAAGPSPALHAWPLLLTCQRAGSFGRGSTGEGTWAASPPPCNPAQRGPPWTPFSSLVLPFLTAPLLLPSGGLLPHSSLPQPLSAVTFPTTGPRIPHCPLSRGCAGPEDPRERGLCPAPSPSPLLCPRSGRRPLGIGGFLPLVHEPLRQSQTQRGETTAFAPASATVTSGGWVHCACPAPGTGSGVVRRAGPEVSGHRPT